MNFTPEPQKEIGIKAGQPLAAVHAQMTAAAERDLEIGTVEARLPVMHDQTFPGDTQPAGAVALEHLVAKTAEVDGIASLAVIAAPAQTGGGTRRMRAAAAPPGRLGHASPPGTT